jgi:hypothetical protein
VGDARSVQAGQSLFHMCCSCVLVPVFHMAFPLCLRRSGLCAPLRSAARLLACPLCPRSGPRSAISNCIRSGLSPALSRPPLFIITSRWQLLQGWPEARARRASLSLVSQRALSQLFQQRAQVSVGTAVETSCSICGTALGHQCFPWNSGTVLERSYTSSVKRGQTCGQPPCRGLGKVRF